MPQLAPAGDMKRHRPIRRARNLAKRCAGCRARARKIRKIFKKFKGMKR